MKLISFSTFSAGLDGVRFLASNHNAAALQTMVNQQNALRSLAAGQPTATLGGAPLILANAAAAAAAAQHRLQLPPTSQASLLANGQAALAASQAGKGLLYWFLIPHFGLQVLKFTVKLLRAVVYILIMIFQLLPSNSHPH